MIRGLSSMKRFNTPQITFLVLLSFGLIFSTVISYKHFDQASALKESKFKNKVDILMQQLTNSSQQASRQLKSLATLFNANHYVNRANFRVFVETIIEANPYVESMEWIPKVPRGKRGTVIRRAKATGLSTFYFKEIKHHAYVPSRLKYVYFPSLYVQPYKKFQGILGYDYGSDPTLMELMNKSRDTGKAIISERSEIIDTSDPVTVQLFAPIYKDKKIPQTLALRQQQLVGFVKAQINIRELIAPTLMGLPSSMDLFLTDRNAPKSKQVLFGRSSSDASMELTKHLRIGERTWQATWSNHATSPFNEASNLFAISFCCFLALAGMILTFMLNQQQITRNAQALIAQVQNDLNIKGLYESKFKIITNVSQHLLHQIKTIKNFSKAINKDSLTSDNSSILFGINQIRQKAESAAIEVLHLSEHDELATDCPESKTNIQAELIKALNQFEAMTDEKGITLNYKINKNVPNAIRSSATEISYILRCLTKDAVDSAQRNSIINVLISCTFKAEKPKIGFQITSESPKWSKHEVDAILHNRTELSENYAHRRSLVYCAQLCRFLGGTMGFRNKNESGVSIAFSIPFQPITLNVRQSQLTLHHSKPAQKPRELNLLSENGPETSKLLNQEQLNQAYEQSPEAIQSAIDEFTRQTPVFIQKLREGIQNKNSKTTKAVVNQWQSLLKPFNAKSMQKLLQTIDYKTRRGKKIKVSTLNQLDQLNEELSQSLANFVSSKTQNNISVQR